MIFEIQQELFFHLATERLSRGSDLAPNWCYLKFDAQMSTIHIEDMSWMRTSRKKLPPVRAHPVYHPRVKAKPFRVLRFAPQP